MQMRLSTELCWTERFICQVAQWKPVTLGICVWWTPCVRRIPAGCQYFQGDSVNWWPGIWPVKTRRKPILWFYCCCLITNSCSILCNPFFQWMAWLFHAFLVNGAYLGAGYHTRTSWKPRLTHCLLHLQTARMDWRNTLKRKHWPPWP